MFRIVNFAPGRNSIFSNGQPVPASQRQPGDHSSLVRPSPSTTITWTPPTSAIWGPHRHASILSPRPLADALRVGGSAGNKREKADAIAGLSNIASRQSASFRIQSPRFAPFSSHACVQLFLTRVFYGALPSHVRTPWEVLSPALAGILRVRTLAQRPLSASSTPSAPLSRSRPRDHSILSVVCRFKPRADALSAKLAPTASHFRSAQLLPKRASRPYCFRPPWLLCLCVAPT